MFLNQEYVTMEIGKVDIYEKILKVFTLLLTVFLLTGCMKMRMNFEVGSDKSVRSSMELLIEESALQASQMTKEDFVQQMEDEILSSPEGQNAKVTILMK